MFNKLLKKFTAGKDDSKIKTYPGTDIPIVGKCPKCGNEVLSMSRPKAAEEFQNIWVCIECITEKCDFRIKSIIDGKEINTDVLNNWRYIDQSLYIIKVKEKSTISSMQNSPNTTITPVQHNEINKTPQSYISDGLFDDDNLNYNCDTFYNDKISRTQEEEDKEYEEIRRRQEEDDEEYYRMQRLRKQREEEEEIRRQEEDDERRRQDDEYYRQREEEEEIRRQEDDDRRRQEEDDRRRQEEEDERRRQFEEDERRRQEDDDRRRQEEEEMRRQEYYNDNNYY